MELQKTWDAKLKRSGFSDIEGGSDTNMYDGSTFRGTGQDGKHGAEVFLGLASGDASVGWEGGVSCGDPQRTCDADVYPNVFQSPRARAWALFSQAANELPTDRRERELLVDVGQCGSLREVSRRRRISKSVLQRLAARLALAIDIEPEWLFGRGSDGTSNADVSRAESRRKAAV